MYGRKHTNIHICMSEDIYIRKHTYMYVCRYVYMYDTYLQIYTCVYKYKYTYRGLPGPSSLAPFIRSLLSYGRSLLSYNIHIEVYQVHLPLPPLLGLFCHMVGLFCHIVGLFCHIVGLFCHIVGLFCHSKYTRSIFPGSDLRDSAAPPTTTATARPEPPDRMFLNVSLEASNKPSMR
jgi:hypothetical protein